MSRPTTMKVDGTVYWTINTYTEAGVLVDADATPIVDIRKNGSAVLDVATSSKRAGTTGIYDYSYNPASEAEGDTFTIEETATISSQSYRNTWSIEVLAAERGTDGANTVAPVDVSANVSSILADTNELQGNQGDWATATTTVSSNMRGTDGANTVVPVDVSVDVAEILADTNELQSNQDNWLTAEVSALSTQSSVDQLQSTSDSILEDTEDLQTHQGDWATATTTVSSNMRGTDNAILASSTPSNWSIMAINGSGEITTSNPASGGGSAHTAQDVANLILAVPTTPLGNTATGSLSLVDTTTDLTNGGSGGDDAATIYSYFTAGSNEDAFKADVSGLSTSVEVQANGILILGLNNFDPASDTVAHVTLVDTTTDLTNGGSGGGSATIEKQNEIIADIAGLNDFNHLTDTVAHVTLVDTTTDLTNGGSGGGGGGSITVKATPTPMAF